MTDDRDLDRVLRMLGKEGQDQPDPAEHPGDGTLSFYHAGELPEEEAERVREHLVVCQRCRDLLLSHAEFMADDEDDRKQVNVAELKAAAEWRAVRERLEKEKRQAAFRLVASLAALFALALLAVSLYAFSLRQELARPITDLESQTLRARGSQRSPEGEDDHVRLPRLLALRISTQKDFASYLVRFRDGTGEVVRSFEAGSDGGVLQFYLPARSLGPGRYRIDVLGLEGAERQAVASYDLRILK